TVPLLDRLDAITEGTTVHIGVEEVVRVPTLGVVGGVVLGVVDRRGRERARFLSHEAAVATLDDERAVDLEERAWHALCAQGAAVRDLNRARGSAYQRFRSTRPDV